MQRRGLPRNGIQRAARLLAAVAVSAVSWHAHAAEPVPIRVDYTAPEGCPTAQDFLGEVAARTSLARLAAPEERATALTLTIREVEGGNKGTLRFAPPEGAASSRDVSAADCGQVVSALALMTALAIDPDASTEPSHPRPKP